MKGEFKENLVKKNEAGQIVSRRCVYKKDCGNMKPHCFDCAFVSHDDIREMMNKLYQYEQTGLTFSTSN